MGTVTINLKLALGCVLAATLGLILGACDLLTPAADPSPVPVTITASQSLPPTASQTTQLLPTISQSPTTSLTQPPKATASPTRTVPPTLTGTATPRPATATPRPSVTYTSTAPYPKTPEEVIIAFLSAVQEESDQMSRYLDSSLRSQIPAGGAAALLKLDGDIEGFAIESGSVSPDPPTALVVVGLAVKGKETSRSFTLVQENGAWYISTITKEP